MWKVNIILCEEKGENGYNYYFSVGIIMKYIKFDNDNNFM